MPDIRCDDWSCPAMPSCARHLWRTRELGMRERMYPQWVHAGRMKQEVADRQIARLKGVIELLEAMAT